MAKRYFKLFLVLLIILLASCDQGPATPDIATYTLKYQWNDDAVPPSESSLSEYAVGELVSAETQGSFVKAGCTLLSWNTEPDGSGVGYAPGLEFEMPDADTVLYGIWIDSTRLIYDTVTGDTFNQTDGTSTFSHAITTFDFGRYEVAYTLWHGIYQWAVSNGYVFENSGREGQTGTIGAIPSSQSSLEPVTTVNWNDVIKWCNAYSELSGYDPVYRDSLGNIIRDAVYPSNTERNDVVYDDSANGFSLPTEGEWQYAAAIISLGPVTLWNPDQESPSPNFFGIQNMKDSVIEWCLDWYNAYPSGPEIDYFCNITSSNRVSRTGNVGDRVTYYKSASTVQNNLGFRIKRR